MGKTGSNPKKQWNFINNLIKSANNTRTDMSTIEYQEKTITSKLKISVTFNNFLNVLGHYE